MDLSIIIVNYREPGFLRQCLKGVQRVARPQLTYEIIVVDNASGDGSVAMVEEYFPEVRLFIQSRNRGLAVANNIGIRAARGRYLLFLNPDIAVFPETLESIVAYLDRHPDVGIVGPRLRNPDGSVQVSCYRFPSPIVPVLRRTPLGKLPAAKRLLRRYLMLDFNHTTDQPVDWVLGACMVVRHSAVEEVGLMDERYFLYYEDVDWCRRFWTAGWKVMYVAGPTLVHYHQRMSAESPGLNGVFQRLTRIHIQSGLKYFGKFRHQPLPTIAATHGTS